MIEVFNMRICKNPNCGVKITASFGSVDAGSFLKFLAMSKAPSNVIIEELCPLCATKKWAQQDGYIA